MVTADKDGGPERGGNEIQQRERHCRNACQHREQHEPCRYFIMRDILFHNTILPRIVQKGKRTVFLGTRFFFLLRGKEAKENRSPERRLFYRFRQCAVRNGRFLCGLLASVL